MKKALVLALVFMIACVPLSFAACSMCEKVKSNDYARAATTKLGRGLSNTAFGWLELFHQPMITQDKWRGIGNGVIHTFKRTGSGILEVVTFLVPQIHVPLPDPPTPFEMKSTAEASK